jgi:hypothetical protein
MEYLVSIKLPEELIGQVERAASSLQMNPEEYVVAALREKLLRWNDDLEDARKFDAIVDYLLDKNHEVYRRLAEWPESKDQL